MNNNSNFLLSILVLTLPSRVSTFLPSILAHLNAQANGKPVQILYLGDNRSMSVGEKRNELLKISKGKYVVFVDDDDRVSDDFVSSILGAMEGDPDAICFDAIKTEERNGNKVNTPMQFSRYNGKNHREKGVLKMIPGHISAIRRSIAIREDFPNKNLSEDHEWADRILPYIQTEVQVDKLLYFYDFNRETSETRWQ